MTSPSKQRAAARRSHRVWVDGLVCDGCGICVFYCKPEVFELSRDISSRGVFPALVLHADACNGCRLCELGCPQLAIFVLGDDEAAGAKR